jgi:type II secretory pathway pseudopilin PulG
MKTAREKTGKKGGFTIVELLTVMSIIILLISLLVPALARVRRYAQFVKQKAQFHAISIALDLFNSEQGGYPPSDRLDTAPAPGPYPYCGAMKLAEAMVGQDILGFNPDSVYRRDGLDSSGTNNLYPINPGFGAPTYPKYVENLKSRRMYLQPENANAFLLTDIYTPAHRNGTAYQILNVTDCNRVLCDIYTRTMITGKKTGMPVLYFKADVSKTEHDKALVVDCTIANNNIYSRCDNQELVDIPLPWVTPVGTVHPMASAGNTLLGVPADPGIFYDKTKDPKITTSTRPYRADSYILMSAGFDGEYGTNDDVFNFSE